MKSLQQSQQIERKARDSASMPIYVMHVIDKLSVSGSGVHGVGRAIEWWIPNFNPREFRFSICSLRAPEKAGEVFEQQGTPVFFLDKGKFDPRTLMDLLKLIRKEQPDILHLHGYGATNFGRLASFLTGVPNIVHEHTVIENQPIYQTIADMLLSGLTTKAIAISAPVRDFMIRQRKIEPSKLETFFYGLPLSEFQVPEQESVDSARKKLGILADEKVVCSIGRLDTQKGQIYLLQAAVSVLKALPQTRFLIVGEGPDRDMLQSFARETGIAGQVIFTGLRKDVPVLLALSDVAAIPSLWEGGPLTLFEAMNLRKPVVCTPVGVMGETICEGVTGFIVPVKSVNPLAERLIYLLQNPELAREMGRKAWEVCQNYDISQSVERLVKVYKQLAS